MRKNLYILMSILWLSAAGTAEAQESNHIDIESDSQFSATLGVGMASAPKFEGSDRYAFSPVPMFELRYGPASFSPAKGFGMTIPAGDFLISSTLGIRPERDIEDDGSIANKTKSMRSAADIGIMWNAKNFALSASAAQGLAQSNKGFTYELGVSHSRPIDERWSYSANISAMYADKDYNMRYFGITPEQSARTGYDIYDAPGGFKHAGAGGGLNYVINEATLFNIFVGYRRLIGPAADSPIVKKGSPDMFFTGFIVLWNFN